MASWKRLRSRQRLRWQRLQSRRPPLWQRLQSRWLRRRLDASGDSRDPSRCTDGRGHRPERGSDPACASLAEALRPGGRRAARRRRAARPPVPAAAARRRRQQHRSARARRHTVACVRRRRRHLALSGDAGHRVSVVHRRPARLRGSLVPRSSRRQSARRRARVRTDARQRARRLGRIDVDHAGRAHPRAVVAQRVGQTAPGPARAAARGASFEARDPHPVSRPRPVRRYAARRGSGVVGLSRQTGATAVARRGGSSCRAAAGP